MKELISPVNDVLFSIKRETDCDLKKPQRFANYSVIFIPAGTGHYHADFGEFEFKGPTILFSTPLQHIFLSSQEELKFSLLQFHGDFYCIEFHQKEVSCNGLLFNNIYVAPLLSLSDQEAETFKRLIADIEEELAKRSPDRMVLIAFLQLFLARASSIKMHAIETEKTSVVRDEKMEMFVRLLEENYLNFRKPNDYADMLSMSPNNFSKRSIRYFKKPPSSLIQERIILEAKKKLHLTRLSIKEISHSLNFEDEYYFSRYFKKITKVSPQLYREKTGISIVADLK
ncbi:helix-turn-helix domain-containing protein [Pedobacter jamesrossensis]|uniref:Helix-turn-helix domain-containing protein n=1 Tax=Pedobacter jamesrossensis TaxID=1908238 RepID=A0ABV8NPC8_9SPHI